MPASQTASFGIPVNSLDALAGTTATNGTEYALPGNKAVTITWQTVFSSAPSAVNVVLQLSNDGVTFVTADTSTATAGEIRTINTSARFFRTRLVSKTGGGTTTTPVVTQPYAVTIVEAGSIFDFDLSALISDGTVGQVLTTDGAGVLTFEDIPAVSVDWGDIGGDLADQTDLQAALDALASDITAVQVRSIVCVIDGGGSAITTGIKADILVPYACTITDVTLLADQSGSIVIDIWKDTYANYPPTDADSITAAAPPTISSATKSQDSTLTGWNTAIAAGSTLRFNVDSITTITRVVLILEVTL